MSLGSSGNPCFTEERGIDFSGFGGSHGFKGYAPLKKGGGKSHRPEGRSPLADSEESDILKLERRSPLLEIEEANVHRAGGLTPLEVEERGILWLEEPVPP